MADDQVRIDELLEHRQWLERFARRVIGDPHAADDAVQSTWVIALRRRPRTSALARAWLRRVLLRELFLTVRKNRRQKAYEALASEVVDVDAASGSKTELSELRAQVVHALDTLPEPYRSTLHLHYLEELTSAEIAAQLDIPSATVRWRVKRGLERLRAGLLRWTVDRPADSTDSVVA